MIIEAISRFLYTLVDVISSRAQQMMIELFSTNCTKCKRLEFNLHQALSELGVDAELIKVKDINEMEKRGLKSVPALAIDGEIKLVGVVPRVSDLIKIISEAQQKT